MMQCPDWRMHRMDQPHLNVMDKSKGKYHVGRNYI
jgi:hypothetical protein